jgi:6-phosphogluconate dehydrogenase
MVHNGIEYGDMQLIAEAYDLLKNIGGLSNKELSQVFDEWNQKELQSFLIEITARIFTKQDDLEGKKGELVDVVVDASGSKGTGMWTVQEGAAKGVSVTTISSALDQRYISSVKQQRVNASKVLTGPKVELTKEKEKFVEDIRNALYCAKIMSYTQGMNLLKKVSDEQKWDLDFGEVSRIWKGGCIIRAAFLDRIKAAYGKNKNLDSLLLDEDFKKDVIQRQDSWRRVVCSAVMNGIPCQAFSASLAYYDSYRREKLPANLIQAQRDFFGAHTYKRLDVEGTFHSEWNQQD